MESDNEPFFLTEVKPLDSYHISQKFLVNLIL